MDIRQQKLLLDNVTKEISNSLDRTSFLGKGIVKLSEMKRIEFPKVHNLTGGTHPSVKFFADGFGGFKYWMAYTPYPGEDKENPSIVCSNDGYNWQTPNGLTNPIEPSPSDGYNNDTELVWDGEKLYCYWRVFYYNGDNREIKRMESTDGKVWSNKKTCTLDNYVDPLSPTIVVDSSGNYKMWTGAYDGNKMRHYKSSNGIDFEYVGECETNYDGFGSHWHPSVWVEGNKFRCLSSFSPKYLYPDTPYTSNRKTILLYGTSSDGVNWEFDSLPFARQGIEGNYDTRIYRSCMVYNGNTHLVYLSGRSRSGRLTEEISVFEATLIDR